MTREHGEMMCLLKNLLVAIRALNSSISCSLLVDPLRRRQVLAAILEARFDRLLALSLLFGKNKLASIVIRD
jgi:hypothetical protein